MRRLVYVVGVLAIALCCVCLANPTKADGIDPAIGIKGGGGSTPLFGPTFSFTFTGTQGTSITEQDFDFINSTGSTVGEVDLLAPALAADGAGPLSYACADASTYFSNCTTAAVDGGATLIRYFGGPGIPNDSNPSCIEGCFSSVPGADFVIFVQALDGDLGQFPTTDRWTVSGTLIPATVPEPATLILASTGLGFAGLIRRRRNKQAA